MHISALRNPTSLNGEWRFTMNEGLYDSRIQPQRKCTIPADIGMCCPEEPNAEGVFLFRRGFTVHPQPERRYFISFGAVNHSCTVFVNGRYAGGSEDGYLPFELEVTGLLTSGENALDVRVDTRRRTGQLPCCFFWKNSAGVVRNVTLYSTPVQRIDSVLCRASAERVLDLTVRAVGAESVCVRLFDEAGELIWTKNKSTNADFDARISEQIPRVLLWNTRTPVLYTLRISIAGDEVELKTGFRSVRTENGNILLNGKSVFLKGFNRHEDSPETGGAVSPVRVKSDFALIKKSGANFVRMCHYPHDESELEEADALGLLLLTELPIVALKSQYWGTVPSADDIKDNEIWVNGSRMLRRMIERDMSHPSVIIHSVSNETAEANMGVHRINDSLMRLAKKLDPSRLCTHVSMPPHCTGENVQINFAHDDVICVNLYPTWGARLNRDNREYDMEAGAAAFFRELLGHIREVWLGKPVIVTEFGYMSETAYEGPDGEEVQMRCITAEYRAIRKYAAGAAVWIFADHMWPPDNHISDQISTFGLLTRDRRPKPAFEAYAGLLREE